MNKNYQLGFKGLVALVLAGVTGFFGCSNSQETEPVKADYDKINRIVLDLTSTGWETFAEDIDSDGFVDCMGKDFPGARYIDFFAKGYNEKCHNYGHRNYSKEMTDEMRNSASSLLKAKKDLAYEIDKQNYKNKQNEHSN